MTSESKEQSAYEAEYAGLISPDSYVPDPDEAPVSPPEGVSSADVPSVEPRARKRVLGCLARPMSIFSPLAFGPLVWSGLVQLSGPHPCARA
jgi:hypothetical protein